MSASLQTTALQDSARRLVEPQPSISARVTLATEILRLREALIVILKAPTENSAEERYARRVRHVARKALAGDAL